MKVQFNEESAKKFTRKYFDTHKIVKQTYDFKYSAGKNQMMHITFNIDVNFFMPTGVTITSILENNKDLDFTFHIFTNEVDEKDLKKLKQTAEKYKQNCIIYVLDMEPFSHFHIKHDRFKRVSYFRLYVPKILKNLTDKFLYIDADLICINSIKAFMKIDLGDKILAAVADLPQACQVKSTHLGLFSGKYFNSGVLWIDAKKWDANNITERCFAYQGVSAEKFTCHDQDVLNLVMDGNIKFLDDKFNHLGFDGSEASEECIIYHFSGREKPWNIALTEYDKIWRKYLTISFWDNIDNPLPPKKPKNYYNYKQAGKFYFSHGNKLEAIKCYFWYSILKIRLKVSV